MIQLAEVTEKDFFLRPIVHAIAKLQVDCSYSYSLFNKFSNGENEKECE